MRWLVLTMILAYKRHISPIKGFVCAYRVRTGHASCSTLGFRAVRRHGVIKGLMLLRERTYLCGVAHRRGQPPAARIPVGQRGDCDPGCDLPCDLPSGKSLPNLADCASCDWPESKKERKRKKSNQKNVYLPPDLRHPR